MARVVMKNHIHASETAGCRIFLLAIKRYFGASFVTDFQEQGARATGGVVNGGGGTDVDVTDAKNFCHDSADFGRRVELALALATLGGEMPHEIFVGIAQDVIAIGTVLGEVEFVALENGDEVSEFFLSFWTIAEFDRVVKVWKVGLRKLLIGSGEWGDDLLVDLITDVGRAFESDHRFEIGTVGNRDGREGRAVVFVADVLDE